MPQDIGVLIQTARELAKKKSVLEAEKKYLEAIDKLEKKNESSKSKAELWTTKAEYLLFRSSFTLKGEEFEDIRKRRIEAIRLLHSTVKLGLDYENLKPRIKKVIDETILSIGCIIPETETHIQINCPIKLSHMGAGEFGTSVGLSYKKAECSICGFDIFKDSRCTHELGKMYNGVVCRIIAKGISLDHVALTKSPKDPNAKITNLSIPKEEFYDNFDPEEIKRKNKEGLPMICSLCKQLNINPKEIDAEKFLSMQGF